MFKFLALIALVSAARAAPQFHHGGLHHGGIAIGHHAQSIHPSPVVHHAPAVAVAHHAPVAVARPVAVAHHAPVAVAHAVAPAVRAEPYDPHPKYGYSYSVSDSLTGDNKAHEESRDGDVVQGRYTVSDPDGTIRTVTYTADDVHGFNAIIDRQAPAKAVAVAAPVHHAPVVHHAPAVAVHHAPAIHAAPVAAVHHAGIVGHHAGFAHGGIAHGGFAHHG